MIISFSISSFPFRGDDPLRFHISTAHEPKFELIGFMFSFFGQRYKLIAHREIIFCLGDLKILDSLSRNRDSKSEPF